MTVTIYHNPNCSNSRGALAILRERGIAPRVIAYLETPPGRPELEALAARLQASAGAAWPGLRGGMLRTHEAVYAALGLDGAGDGALLDAVAAHPVLMNRPIVVTPKGAVLCRPPHKVLEIL